ncbi:MAG: hypothetical protein RLW61_10735 [Gammaproteobacteria bacterium]
MAPKEKSSPLPHAIQQVLVEFESVLVADEAVDTAAAKALVALLAQGSVPKSDDVLKSLSLDAEGDDE